MEVNNVGANAGVNYSASTVNTSSSASNEPKVKDSSNVNSANATEDSKKTDDSKKPEEPKDKDKTQKNKEKEELQKQIEELKKQLEELKKKLQEQQKPQENCSKPEGAQQSPQAQQAQQPDQNQNDPNQLILQDIMQVLEAEKNGGIGVQQAVNKLKQDYMMVKSMNVALKPEVDQMSKQILQKYGNLEIGANPLLSNQLAAGLNPTQAVNPLNNIQQPQTQGINF
jgi:flagellar biosynthesis GTPase FlhF